MSHRTSVALSLLTAALFVTMTSPVAAKIECRKGVQRVKGEWLVTPLLPGCLCGGGRERIWCQGVSIGYMEQSKLQAPGLRRRGTRHSRPTDLHRGRSFDCAAPLVRQIPGAGRGECLARFQGPHL
jgi:hypothetical protein